MRYPPTFTRLDSRPERPDSRPSRSRSAPGDVRGRRDAADSLMVVVTTALRREHGARARTREARRSRLRRGGHRRWSRDRIWHAAEHVELAGLREPSRVEISAAVQRVRVAAGRTSAGDDELFAHLVALVHVLYAKAHTEGGKDGSARFATTYEQIMSALAQKFGIWGPAPTKDSPDREAWVAHHRPRLYDWLEILRRAELLSHDSRGVKDNARVWWRTEITVLGVPASLTREELDAAAAYAAAFQDRERDRRRRGRLRPYAEIFRKAKPPTTAQKKTKAVATARAAYQAKRDSSFGSSGGPFSPAFPSGTAATPESFAETQTFKSPYTPKDRTGESKLSHPGSPDEARWLRHNQSAAPAPHPHGKRTRTVEHNGNPVIGKRTGLKFGQSGAKNGHAGRRRPSGPVLLVDRAVWVQQGAEMAQRLREGLIVDVGAPGMPEAITRAWYVTAYGEEEMLRLLPWSPRFDVAELREAASLYSRHLAARLPGMPVDPIAALMRMASTPLPPYERHIRRTDGSWKTVVHHPQRPETIGYAVRGLRMLARDMAAANVLLEDRKPQIRWAGRYQQPQPGRFAFRTATDTSVWAEETTAQRAERIRDQLLAAGGNPRRHDSLDTMELELIDRERHDLLPHDYSHPSPTAMRAHRGAWMPDWYTPAPSPTSPVDAWNRLLSAAAGKPTSEAQAGPFVPERWISENDLTLWLSALSPIQLADGTLTVAGEASYTGYVRQRLHQRLEDLARTLGIAQRLRITDLDEFTGGRHITPPAPQHVDADGKHARARRHLRRIEQERLRLLNERFDAQRGTWNGQTHPGVTPAVAYDTWIVNRRRLQSPDNKLWDEILDVAATRAEFQSELVVDLWLRPLLPHFGNDGILTLYGTAATLQPVRTRLGEQLTHLIRLSGGHGITWHALDEE